ncbi:hypothetical protein P4C99_18400 [Pontiellaceae bacterium B1224]|nr:hypothetical protein [Pontiellaceae bacterium B1224]
MNIQKYIYALLICIYASISFGDENLKPFAITLESSPEISLILDRKYEVMSFKKPEQNLVVFMFIPEDDQSSAILGIGKGGNRKTIESIKKGYEGAVVQIVKGRLQELKLIGGTMKIQSIITVPAM